MAHARLSLYTDEDVYAALAVQLQRRGYDTISCYQAGNAGKRLSDEWQLTYAVQEYRAILSHNISDYVRLDRLWKLNGREHYGIIVVEKRITIGELVRRTEQYLATVTRQEHHNVLRFLPG